MKSDSQFQTTCWTQVLSAAHTEGADSQVALMELCQNYYQPICAYVKRSGLGEDLTHDFFNYLLEKNRFKKIDPSKGKFRSYLLGILKHFLSQQNAKHSALKRGGKGETDISINQTGFNEHLLDSSQIPPDNWFDQQWALTIISRALSQVKEDCRNSGKEKQFDLLSPWLTGDVDYGDQASLANQMGIPLNTLKSLVFRLRKKFRDAVKTEISETLDNPSPSDIETEMAALFAALRKDF